MKLHSWPLDNNSIKEACHKAHMMGFQNNLAYILDTHDLTCSCRCCCNKETSFPQQRKVVADSNKTALHHNETREQHCGPRAAETGEPGLHLQLVLSHSGGL